MAPAVEPAAARRKRAIFVHFARPSSSPTARTLTRISLPACYVAVGILWASAMGFDA
jgi:hypothetical protein